MKFDSRARNLFAAVGFVTLVATGCAVSDQLESHGLWRQRNGERLGRNRPGERGQHWHRRHCGDRRGWLHRRWRSHRKRWLDGHRRRWDRRQRRRGPAAAGPAAAGPAALPAAVGRREKAGRRGRAGRRARRAEVDRRGPAGSRARRAEAESTGTGGSAGSTGKGGSTGTGGSAPTFTQVYTTVLVTYCSGSSCHNPGSQKGVSFASQSTAYSAVKSRVTAGNGAGSSFYQTVNGGSMPPGQKLSAANIALIKSWIDAGALNN